MNLDNEIRNGCTIQAEMKKVWQVQLALVKKLLEVCEKHDLKVWAEGGTLLGTVREHGYIPWDDDIDMAMLRPDYDKLVSLATQEFQHPYFFQCGYTEKVFPRGHSQLRMDGTTAIMLSSVFQHTHQGIFIDIFPFDAVPDSDEEMKLHVKERNKLFTKLGRSAIFDWLHPFRSLGLLKYKSRFAELYKEYEDLFRNYRLEDCNRVMCLSFIDDVEHFLRDKHWYDETIYMSFEDILMPVPLGYHEILTKQYGDYMTPIQAPSYHGGFWKLDADKGYENYLPEMKHSLKRLNRQKTIQRIKKIITKH